MESPLKILKIGVDIGGTFTDLVLVDDRNVLVHKVLSTPRNPAIAVLAGIAEILELNGYYANSPVDVVHGSTVATNALLERKGAKVALITTKGFEDIIEIGRQNRAELYNFYVERAEPLVPSELRFGVSERTLYTGEIIQPLNEDEVEVIKEKLKRLKVESIAICFLFSYANPENEAKAYQILQDMNYFALSHLIVPEYREYERFSTTVVNAYIAPVVKRYINSLENQVNGSLRIMQSNGGSISAQTASEQPVRTILSGPAGGVVGAFEVAKLSGFEKAITFDMGGTSTDVCLCDKEVKITTEGEVGGCPIKVPLIDIHTVGAGGGSIAYVDEGGALRVGPQSAGADPGPICYGKSGGDEITVTDANVFLGRIPPDHFLGGKMKLDVERVGVAMSDFAKKLGYTPKQAAEGIIKVVNATMERAIRVISIERGYDPREFALVSFGGAGGLHAGELARSLSVSKVLIPKNPGTLSALGMLVSNVIKSYSQTVLLRAEKEVYQKLAEIFEAMESHAFEEMEVEGFRTDEVAFQRSADMRYEGQSYEVNLPFDENFLENFNKVYIQKFGYSNVKNVVEVVILRLNAIASPPKPSFQKDKRGKRSLASPLPHKALIDKRSVMIFEDFEETPVYNRDLLRYGNEINEPAIIVEYSATTMIPHGFICNVDEYGNLLMFPRVSL